MPSVTNKTMLFASIFAVAVSALGQAQESRNSPIALRVDLKFTAGRHDYLTKNNEILSSFVLHNAPLLGRDVLPLANLEGRLDGFAARFTMTEGQGRDEHGPIERAFPCRTGTTPQTMARGQTAQATWRLPVSVASKDSVILAYILEVDPAGPSFMGGGGSSYDRIFNHLLISPLEILAKNNGLKYIPGPDGSLLSIAVTAEHGDLNARIAALRGEMSRVYRPPNSCEEGFAERMREIELADLEARAKN